MFHHTNIHLIAESRWRVSVEDSVLVLSCDCAVRTCQGSSAGSRYTVQSLRWQFNCWCFYVVSLRTGNTVLLSLLWQLTSYMTFVQTSVGYLATYIHTHACTCSHAHPKKTVCTWELMQWFPTVHTFTRLFFYSSLFWYMQTAQAWQGPHLLILTVLYHEE